MIIHEIPLKSSQLNETMSRVSVQFKKNPRGVGPTCRLTLYNIPVPLPQCGATEGESGGQHLGRDIRVFFREPSGLCHPPRATPHQVRSSRGPQLLVRTRGANRPPQWRQHFATRANYRRSQESQVVQPTPARRRDAGQNVQGEEQIQPLLERATGAGGGSLDESARDPLFLTELIQRANDRRVPHSVGPCQKFLDVSMSKISKIQLLRYNFRISKNHLLLVTIIKTQ